jgi:hypothetical protein
MSTIVKKKLHCLHVLQSASPKLRKAILENADPELVRAIAECCINFLYNKLKVPNDSLRKLRQKRTVIRELAHPKTSIAKKKKLLVQSGGGFLSLLLPAAITLIGSLINKASK